MSLVLGRFQSCRRNSYTQCKTTKQYLAASARGPIVPEIFPEPMKNPDAKAPYQDGDMYLLEMGMSFLLASTCRRRMTFNER